MEYKLQGHSQMRRENPICPLNLQDGAAPHPQDSAWPTHERLVRAFSRLQEIQLVRNCRQDPRFGRPAEDRIVWRELLELELQDVDEQVEQILAAAETAKRTESVK